MVRLIDSFMCFSFVHVTHLHSTMVRLIELIKLIIRYTHQNLHSTMVRLIGKAGEGDTTFKFIYIPLWLD